MRTLVAALLLAALPASALEVGGVKVPDTVTVDGTSQSVGINASVTFAGLAAGSPRRQARPQEHERPAGEPRGPTAHA